MSRCFFNTFINTGLIAQNAIKQIRGAGLNLWILTYKFNINNYYFFRYSLKTFSNFSSLGVITIRQ